MKFGNRASLEAIPRKTEDVPFPEFDTFYRLREMSGTERDKFEISAFKVTTNGSGDKREIDPLYLRARLVGLCMIDEDGKRCYADNEIQKLADAVPSSVLGKLFTTAQKLNGLDAGAVEAAAKNSESGPDSASGSV